MIGNFLRFAFRPPMFAFLIVSNVAVSVLSREQMGLWYTPVACLVLILTATFTVKHYGYRRR